MKLIKIRSKKDGKIKQATCGMNEARNSGEATLCGWAVWNGDMKRHGFESAGGCFEGAYKKITCPECKEVIAWFQRVLEAAK